MEDSEHFNKLIYIHPSILFHLSNSGMGQGSSPSQDDIQSSEKDSVQSSNKFSLCIGIKRVSSSQYRLIKCIK